MIVHNCTQGSSEWKRLRMGRPTASAFDRIITPTGKVSSQAEGYINDLLAELMLGEPLDGPTSPWMDRGHQLESEARAFYELQTGCDVVQVGFTTTDDGRIGASPDGLVGEDGLLEIKVPKASTHVSYLLSERGVDKAYLPQVQGQLYVTGRNFVDIVSYYPGLPEAMIRVERDEEFIALLAAGLKTFCDLLDARREKLAQRGWLAEQRETPEEDWLGVSQEDVDLIVKNMNEKERTGVESISQ